MTNEISFFRLEFERWEHLHWCFETLRVCRSLFVVAIQLCWNFKRYCFYFFPKSAVLNWGCGLSTDAAYTWTFTVDAQWCDLEQSGGPEG